jgi:hypothetical protein
MSNTEKTAKDMGKYVPVWKIEKSFQPGGKNHDFLKMLFDIAGEEDVSISFWRGTGETMFASMERMDRFTTIGTMADLEIITRINVYDKGACWSVVVGLAVGKFDDDAEVIDYHFSNDFQRENVNLPVDVKELKFADAVRYSYGVVSKLLAHSSEEVGKLA